MVNDVSRYYSLRVRNWTQLKTTNYVLRDVDKADVEYEKRCNAAPSERLKK